MFFKIKNIKLVPIILFLSMLIFHNLAILSIATFLNVGKDAQILVTTESLDTTGAENLSNRTDDLHTTKKFSSEIFILCLWFSIAVIFLYTPTKIPKTKTAHVWIIQFLSITCIGIASFIVIAQIHIAKRSLAEAWLTLFREGEAFGFFSFFITQIYALFLLAPSYFFVKQKWLLYGLSFTALHCLFFGFLFANSLLFFLFVCLALIILILSKNHKIKIIHKIKSFIPPFVAALIFSLFFLVLRTNSSGHKYSLRLPDFSKLALRIAPTFPLLRDVPGYGFTIGSGSMPKSVYLSPRQLFAVQGNPYETHYLAEARYTTWTGNQWIEDENRGTPLAIYYKSKSGIPLNYKETEKDLNPFLKLLLTEDFTSQIPTSLETHSVILQGIENEKVQGSNFFGVQISPSVRKGMVTELVRKGKDSNKTEPLTHTRNNQNAPSPLYFLENPNTTKRQNKIIYSSRLHHLAQEILNKSNSEHEFIQNLLHYFSKDFIYSLETKQGPSTVDRIESFVFEGKKGFCLYFASAFVLIAHEAGLNARLVEGYRVQLNNTGYGSITGYNAHAWPEVFIDNEW